MTRTVEFSGPTMGTFFVVKVVAGEAGLTGDARAAVDRAIRDELQLVDVRMSTWRDDSEVSRFNATASTEPFPLSSETFEVLHAALAIGAETGGALDVTIGPLIDVWGFGPHGASGRAPDSADVEAVLPAVGLDTLELDATARTVRKRHPDTRVELSAIAPGWVADRIAAMLERRGFTDFLIDVSGELVARGRNESGLPWQVAVERPQSVGRGVARVIPLEDAAIATSGDYRNYREEGGRRLSHILDPRTRRPVEHTLASVSVIAPTCMRADALSTALMVMGAEEAIAFGERAGLAVLLLVREADGTFAEQMSPALAAFLDVES